MSISYIRGNEAPESQFPKVQTFLESVEILSRNRHPNFTQNEYIYAICCRREIAGDIISGGNVSTIEGYAVLYFEAASFSSFRDIPKNHFVAAKADIDDRFK